MKKYRNRFMIGILIVLIIAGFVYFKSSDKRRIEIISSNIEEKVSRIVELSTIKYNYTDIVTYKDNLQVQGLNIPFTGKSFIIKYSGYLKAGIDLETLEFDVVDKDTVNMTMNKGTILENVIIEEDVVFFDEKSGIFNKLSFDDLYKVLIEEKDRVEKETIEKGLLVEAEKNAKEIITSLLEGMGFENINISFK